MSMTQGINNSWRIRGQIIDIASKDIVRTKKGVQLRYGYVLKIELAYSGITKKIYANLWGQKNILKYNLRIGDVIDAYINLNSWENKGKWETDVSLCNIRIVRHENVIDHTPPNDEKKKKNKVLTIEDISNLPF